VLLGLKVALFLTSILFAQRGEAWRSRTTAITIASQKKPVYHCPHHDLESRELITETKRLNLFTFFGS
jgi:hypothetical protein